MPILTSTIACINSRWRRLWRKGGKEITRQGIDEEIKDFACEKVV
jgi:hypothetical protein